MCDKQIVPITEEFKVSDLRLVTIHWQDTGTQTTHFVVAPDVQKLAQATLRLHHTPAVDPGTGGQTRKICIATSEPMAFYGPYRWMTPGLAGNDDPAGARVLQGNGHREILFEDKKIFNPVRRGAPRRIDRHSVVSSGKADT
jgi:hypothetical protein